MNPNRKSQSADEWPLSVASFNLERMRRDPPAPLHCVGGASCRLSSSPRAFPICEIYFGLESGGQSGRASMGLPPLCTVGAADFEPPASGRTALFSTAMEFDVLSPALPDVAAVEVVQLVSCFSLDAAVDWATAGPTTNDPAKIAAPTRLIILSLPKRKDDVHKSRAERSRVTKGSGSILLRRMIPEVALFGHLSAFVECLLLRE